MQNKLQRLKSEMEDLQWAEREEQEAIIHLQDLSDPVADAQRAIHELTVRGLK